MTDTVNRSIVDVARVVGRRHLPDTAIVVGLFVVASFAEVLGLATLLPIITVVSDQTVVSGGLTQRLLDLLEQSSLPITLPSLLGLVVAGVALKSLFEFLATWRAGAVTARIASQLRLDLIDALMHARWEYFTDHPVGAMANAVGIEADHGSGSYIDLTRMVASVVTVTAYMTLAFLVSWPVSLAALGIGAVMGLALRGFVRAGSRSGLDFARVMRSMTVGLVDSMGALKPVRAMGREDAFHELLADETRAVEVAQRSRVLNQAQLAALQEPITVLFVAIGVVAIDRTTPLPFDELLFLAFLFLRTMSRVSLLQRQYQQIRSREASLWSITDATAAAAAAREVRRGLPAPRVGQAIELDRVSVRYGEKIVLHDLTARIDKGAFTAVIGPSGSGKSTLVDLLVALRQPDSGAVLVDGADLSTIDLGTWRTTVGYVPQEPVVFNASVRVNVGMRLAGVTDDEIWDALRRAGLDDVVRAMPGALDAGVGERGGRLSGGQRQRLSIARALVNDPQLLILDEATTGLDLETERAILQTIVRDLGRLTVIAISHQPTIREFADKTIELTIQSATDP